MILSFASKESEKIWNGERSNKLPTEIQDAARRKLRMLNNSHNIADLKVPPSNRLEKLAGHFKEYFSIRINDKRQIIFKWKDGNASLVEITNYR